MKKILSLIAVLSLATLTACGQVNSAATLGDITISQSQLQTGGDLNRSQLRFLVITTLFDEIAKELKLDVTKTEMVTTRQQMIAQSGGEEAFASNLVGAQIASTNFDKYVRVVILSDKLTAALKESGISEEEVGTRISQLIAAKGKELKIEINPRYGTWDAEAGDILPVDSAGDAVTTPATN